MKKIVQISFLTGIVMLFFLATAYSQQRPSQRSFTSIMDEVNQKRAARDKMLQQIKQATPSNIVLSSTSTQSQLAPGSTITPTAAQKSLSSPATNQQPANKQKNSQLKSPIIKKQ
jgi:phosphodiesterase/alkaline phosphatase D-like protein